MRRLAATEHDHSAEKQIALSRKTTAAPLIFDGCRDESAPREVFRFVGNEINNLPDGVGANAGPADIRLLHVCDWQTAERYPLDVLRRKVAAGENIDNADIGYRTPQLIVALLLV